MKTELERHLESVDVHSRKYIRCYQKYIGLLRVGNKQGADFVFSELLNTVRDAYKHMEYARKIYGSVN